MQNGSLLYGLNAEQSLIAIWKLLFKPSLRDHFGAEWSLDWCAKLVDTFIVGDHDEFSDQYNTMAAIVKPIYASEGRPTIESPPWAMISLDMRIGIIPWISPMFDQLLLLLFLKGMAFEQHFGAVLPLAFVLAGGPGSSKETAIRICAPDNATRASAEHWLMRAYLLRPKQGPHFTFGDDDGRHFSMHAYTDERGTNRSVFFDTTDSFGRERADFLNFLNQDDDFVSQLPNS